MTWWREGRLRRARSLRAVAAAAAVAVLAGACSSGPSRPVVAVIGDSITFLAASDIRADLGADGDQVLITGRIGYTAAQLAGDVTDFASHHPRVVLFEMGTNDVSQTIIGATSVAAYERAVAGYRNQFGSACLIATTVSSHRDTPALDQAATAVNAWLHANFRNVVEWDDYEWAQRQAGHVLVEPDLVHPNPDGQRALAGLDQAAVRSCRR